MWAHEIKTVSKQFESCRLSKLRIKEKVYCYAKARLQSSEQKVAQFTMDEDCMAKLEREATKVWAKMVELKTECPNRMKYAAMSPKTLRRQANKSECMSIMEDFD